MSYACVWEVLTQRPRHAPLSESSNTGVVNKNSAQQLEDIISRCTSSFKVVLVQNDGQSTTVALNIIWKPEMGLLSKRASTIKTLRRGCISSTTSQWHKPEEK